MINIQDKKNCVGCNACVQRCPKSCIKMFEDEQGFLYPKVDVETCISCGFCERVCPVINQEQPHEPINTYAAWNPMDNIRMTSSSGGVFFPLAKQTIDQGGVVFGAKFNDRWEVVHDFAETIEGVKAFQGSKYVQSRIGISYLEAEKFLKNGRKVLFSGTPCQIAGLHRFLRKDYTGLLITVDVVCHGAPSPRIWKEYLELLMRPQGARKNTASHSILHPLNKIPAFEGISFRDKRISWEKFGFAIQYAAPKGGQNSASQFIIDQREEFQNELFEPLTQNLYMQGFLKDLYLRPSCYACPVKCGKSHSDITLGDFWGIRYHHPSFHSDKGVSLVMTNTDLGITALRCTAVIAHDVNYNEALAGNPSLEKSVGKPHLYTEFWSQYSEKGIGAISAILDKMRPSLCQRVYSLARRILGRLKRFILG